MTRVLVAALLVAGALPVVASSFPAYAKFRVKHMELYRLAKRIKTKE